jgi:hypothetical protein
VGGSLIVRHGRSNGFDVLCHMVGFLVAEFNIAPQIILRHGVEKLVQQI